MTRLATGIQGFDGMVQGGLPVGSSVILQGPPGQEKLSFALMFLADGLKAGASGLVVISSQSPDAVLAELRNLGVDLDAVTSEHRLRIVDWYSWGEESVHDIEERGPVVRSSIDLTNLGVALSRAIAALSGDQPRRAVIELLSPATNVYELTQVYAFAQSAKKKFARHGFTSLVLLEKDMHSGSELTTLHQPFDGVIEIERTRSGDRIVRKIGVLHLKDTAPDPSFRVLEIAPSGMRVVREAAKAATPPTPVPAGTALESQEERAHRLTLIMQIAGERLKLNPRDTDALFAMAAAQATLDDSRGGLQSLERLSELDPRYPGLWVLKTKLHARLGEADRARESRLRGQQAEPAESEPPEATVPCPMCDSPVAVDATTCGNCGVKFAPSRKLEDELEDLGHAAIQEMVHEGFQEETQTPPAPPRKPAVRKLPEPAPRTVLPPRVEVAAPPKPAPKPSPKKGLTNGLVLGRGSGRRTGMTNGLRGRTNGLRGRTNGLTNGLGRTNGLTNGVGRTNGLTNGLGRTNGLTNGLGRTNGLTNGLGRTNGITNGLGRTNGLTNGLGSGRASGFRSTGFRGMMRTAGWKLYVIPLVVVGLLLMPLFFVPEYRGLVSPIAIDGQFGDWSSVTTAAMGSGSVPNPNIDVVRFGVVDNLGPQAFYVQVAGIALQGGGATPGTMDSARIFVDTDGSAGTGYRIDGLGADRMIEVSGYAGVVRMSTLWEFDANRDTRDWGGWIKGTGTPAASSGSQIEAEAEWLSSGPTSVPFAATVHTASWNGETDVGDFPISPGGGSLTVVSLPEVPAVLSGTGIPLLRLSLSGHGQTVSMDSLTVLVVGTAPVTAALSLRLMDGGTILDQEIPTTRDVVFSFPEIPISDGATRTLSVVGDFTDTSGDTSGLRLPSAHPFGIDAPAVGLREDPGARTLGYLGSPPATPRVDGAFGEWSSPAADGADDVTPRANPAVDLIRHGAIAAGGSTHLYADVTGRVFLGTSVPEFPRPTPFQGPPAPADSDRDTVPDSVDPFPLDFNNDGTPDGNTNGDYDGDSILDYGFVGGTDYWLNTTLPGSFPAPYAGRPVSVFIGPTDRPPAIGEDAFRLFLDIDNSTATGFLISGIGADRLVEVRGKDGQVTQSALLTFTGSFPGQWSWSPLSPLTVAVGYHAFELSVPLTVSRGLAEAGDFWGSTDSTAAAPALAPSFVSFWAAPANAPLSVPWMQVGPQPASTLIDAGSNSPTTPYNHQRKVVRAGNSPGNACDATNSDGCWYAVFADQLAGREPSTETITTGTSCGGSFPTDIGTSNDAYRCYREANLGGTGSSPTFQSLSSIAASTGADVTVTLPSHAANDVLLLLGWVRDQDDTVSVSGWTAISGTPFDRSTASRYWLFWRRATSGSETNPLFDKDTATGDTYAAVIVFRGAQPTGDPWEVVGSASTGTSDPASISGITTSTANSRVVVPVGGEDDNNAAITTTGTDPSAYTEHYVESITGAAGAITFSEAGRTTAGATGSISVDWGTANPVGWGGMALALRPNLPDYELNVKYDYTSVPSGAPYILHVEAHHTAGEDMLVQVVDSTEATWTTRITITKTADDDSIQTYTLTTDEYDAGSPNIRFIGATESGDSTQSDLSVDLALVGLWDRIVLRRSADTSGSTWGTAIVLASGESGVGLLSAYDSAEPSIAIDSAGYLHVVWVSGSSTGDQTTMNLVRYTKTTVAYPTQGDIASASNWAASVTAVDDASTGFMPTVSTDTNDRPHVAWSGSKTSGTVYYKNMHGGTWRSTVSWGTTYTGLSVDVSPQNNYVSLARYYEAATDEIQYTVCKDLSTSTCDASAEFTRWNGTAGVDPVATGIEAGSYPSLATTYDTNGDLWVAYAKDVDGSTRAIYVRFLDYPSTGWASAETVDSASGSILTKPSIGVDKDNVVHALYVRNTGPQVYYRSRTGGTWGTDTIPSTETITKGSKIAGTFAGDLGFADSTFLQYREASGSILSYVGAFSITTGSVGATVAVTGTGFQPKAILFWWSGRTETSDTTDGKHIVRGFGVAVSTTDRRLVYARSEDGSGTSDSNSGHHDAAAIGALDVADGSVAGLADLQSMDSNGFTMVIDDQFPDNLRIHYLALGGTDLTNAVSGVFTEPSATGTQQITSLAFQPDAVVFFSGMIGADPPGTAVDSPLMIGVAGGNTPSNAVWAGGSNDAAATMQTISYNRVGESIALFDSTITATDGRASVTSWLSNGFQLNWAERAGSRRIHYLALKGGVYHVGDLLTQTDTSTQIVESGLGFSPKATLLGSNALSQSSQDTPQDHDRLSLGAFSWPNRGAQGTRDVDGISDAQAAISVEHDAIYVSISDLDQVEGLMDIQSVGTDGFTAIMDDADPSQRFVWYLAVGAAATLEVRYDWSGVPSGSTYTLSITGYRTDENIEVQVLTNPSTWNTRIVISATSSALHLYTLTSGEYDSGTPSIRFVDANAIEGTQSDVYIDASLVATDVSRDLVDSSSDHPTLVVRAPNDATYGTTVGGLYWKSSTSETYFYIPEFETIVGPILGVLVLGLLGRRRIRRVTIRRGD